ncbi:MAG: hypothetical protein LBK74_07905, partial [Treponema sp.]|nr:hypothetical protein [Treponema sp.]
MTEGEKVATTTYSDMTAAETLHDEDVFAVDQPSGNVSRKTRLDQVAEYVGNKAVAPEKERAESVEESLAEVIEELSTHKANIVFVPKLKTLAEAVVSDVLKAITFDTSSTPPIPAVSGNIVFSDGSSITQIIDSDIALANGKKLLGVKKDTAQANLLSVGDYGTYEQ